MFTDYAEWPAMKLLSSGWRLVAIVAVCTIGGGGFASITSHDYEGHRSSLRATLTMVDGSTRSVTLEGVGCPTGVCSRVKAKESKANNIWLDGVASVRRISHNGAGPVTATFKFKDGTERQASIISVNRVLYVSGRVGRTEKLDLGTLSKIDFE